MKTIATLALLSLALAPAALAGLTDAAKSAVKVTKPAASIDGDGNVKVTKPSVEVEKPSLPEVKKPELPEIKKPALPEVKKPEVTKPSATIDANGIKVVKPGLKLK